MSVSWNMERTLSLIEDIRTNPCLWDTSSADYKSRIQKSTLYEELAKKYEVSSSEAEKKIQGLKSQFRREHKKETDKKNVKGKCSWFGYTPLLFLTKNDGPADEGTVAPGIKIKADTSDSFVEPDESLADMSEMDYSNYSIDDSQSHSQSMADVDMKAPKKPENDKLGQDTLQCMKTLIDVVTKRDEFSVYGEYVSDKLRESGRSSLEVHIAQHHIDNVVFNLIMGVYGRGATGGAGMTNLDPATGIINVALKEEKE